MTHILKKILLLVLEEIPPSPIAIPLQNQMTHDFSSELGDADSDDDSDSDDNAGVGDASFASVWRKGNSPEQICQMHDWYYYCVILCTKKVFAKLHHGLDLSF